MDEAYLEWFWVKNVNKTNTRSHKFTKKKKNNSSD